MAMTPEAIIHNADLEALLPTVGNHEGRAMLVLTMEPGKAYTANTLDDLFWSLDPDGSIKNVWNENNAINWCKTSLREIGGIAIVNPKAHLSDYGAWQGRAFAAEALLIGKDHDIGLQTLWSATQAAGSTNRPPLARYAITQMLLTANRSMTAREIAEGIGRDPIIIRRHLSKLAGSDLVTYSTDAKPAMTTYRAETDYPLRSSATQLTGAILKCVQNHPDIDGVAVADMLWAAPGLPKDGQADRHQFDAAVHTGLFKLAKRGALSREERIRSAHEVSLSTSQQALWSDVIDRINALQSHNASGYEAVIRQGRELIQDPSIVAGIIERYRRPASISK